MSTSVTVKFGRAPAPTHEGPLPQQAPGAPRDMTVTRHLVGYTEVNLSNGDVVRLHLYVDAMIFNPENGGFVPRYRLVPEVVKAAFSWNCHKLEGPLS